MTTVLKIFGKIKDRKAAMLIPFHIAIIFLQSCSSTVYTEKELLKWIHDKDNGLVKSQQGYDLTFTCKYLPHQYLAHRDAEIDGKLDHTKYDSLVKTYAKNRTFLITIAPKDKSDKDFDIMYYNITKYEEYEQRVHQLNFLFTKYIALKTEKGNIHPVLSRMENIYGMSRSRNIMVVFAPESDESQLESLTKLDVVFSDEIFDTGIHHFLFKQSAIENIPQLIVKKNTL